MARLLHKNYSEPEICPKDPQPADISRPWFVHFRYYNVDADEWQQFPYKKGLNYLRNYDERLKAAQAMRDGLKSQLEAGWNPITNAIPVDRIVNPAENQVAKMGFAAALRFALQKCDVAEGSLKEYRQTVSQVVKACRGVPTPLSDGTVCNLDYSGIEVLQIKRYHIRLILDNARQKNKWTDVGYNKHLGNLQAVLSRLVTLDAVEHNPAHDIPYLSVPESDKYQSLNEEEKKVIREDVYLVHYGFYVYLMTLYHTGMRPFEALALRLLDLRLEQRIIRIVPDRRRDNSKTKKLREIPVNDELYGLLATWIVDYEDQDLYTFGSPYTSGRGNAGSVKGGITGAMHPDYFKPSTTRIKRDTVTKLWDKLLTKKLGVDRYMYDLKFTGGDDKILAGVDLDALRDLYGHTNKRMSARYAKRLKEVYKNEIIQKSKAF